MHAISVITNQLVEGVVDLRQVRVGLEHAPHVRLLNLRRLDDRLAACLDGIVVAGGLGSAYCAMACESYRAANIFLLGVQGFLAGSTPIATLMLLSRNSAEAERGLLGALGWVGAPALRDPIRGLLTSSDPLQRRIALAACALHRVDPGPPLDAAFTATDTPLRDRAFRVAGDVGRMDLLPLLQAAALRDSEPAEPRFWAARSAVMLGDRGSALALLNKLAEGTDPFSDAAAELALKALDLPTAHQHLRHCAAQTKPDTPAAAQARRRLIRRCGITGDPHFIPWLIAQMTDLRLTRLAGEAFSMITGADLAWLDLDRKPPAGIDFGPNDDPEDDNVAMDEDDGLPWPDPDKVQAWWQTQQHRFPAGQRFFIGEPPSPAHALKVLRDGFQRQRIAAAQWACLLTPGTKLFPTAAPAWRQQRWLKAMG
ncbi:TIGR02270 family protein [Sphaerotilus sp.]|uniref:TIGR02270 family protein n=1 Tax=Sphaerotilus sp. TaxID=2093942 RepID=UPI002ACE6455|nr:TIGR02270 family protein [Sphaerotilus sp.]MDZ7856482.1 TIGR02270 family protein [Sphaerotilus sp.]